MIHNNQNILLQDILCKIKGVLVDEKKHVRYGDWNVYDVSVQETLIDADDDDLCLIYLDRLKFLISICSSHRNLSSTW